MKYLLYIKSHCESPDYEDEVEAKDRKEACLKFFDRLPLQAKYDWNEDMLEPYVDSEKDLEAEQIDQKIDTFKEEQAKK
jgi:hypothetical protein